MKHTASNTAEDQAILSLFTQASLEIDEIVSNESHMGSGLKLDVYFILDEENESQVKLMTTIRFSDLIDHIEESGSYDEDSYGIGFQFERHMSECEKRGFAHSYLVELQSSGRMPEITFIKEY